MSPAESTQSKSTGPRTPEGKAISSHNAADLEEAEAISIHNLHKMKGQPSGVDTNQFVYSTAEIAAEPRRQAILPEQYPQPLQPQVSYTL